jgi:hypothetical protein
MQLPVCFKGLLVELRGIGPLTAVGTSLFLQQLCQNVKLHLPVCLIELVVI